MQFPADLLNAFDLNRALGRNQLDLKKTTCSESLGSGGLREPASIDSPITPSCIHLPVDCGMDRIAEDGLFH